MHPDGIARLNIFFYGEAAVFFGATMLVVRAAGFVAAGHARHSYFRPNGQFFDRAMNGANEHSRAEQQVKCDERKSGRSFHAVQI
jgi:hypothetical protein